MRRLLRRLGIGIAVLALLFVVLRAIVVPLARQRQERRQLDPTLVALIPAETGAWLLRRGAIRQPADALWPEGRDLLERRLGEWAIPLESLGESLGIGRLAGGPWLAGSVGDDDWFFGGRRSRLPWGTPFGERLSASPDSLFQLAEGVLALSGPFFLVASRAELHGGEGWLEELPEWTEIGDLLVGSDLLEYRACDSGGALMGAKPMLGVLLVEGLAWNCQAGLALLAAMSPGEGPPDSSPLAEAELAALPLLRRSAPFGPLGRPLLPVGAGLLGDAGHRVGERRWAGDGTAALCRVLAQPSP